MQRVIGACLQQLWGPNPELVRPARKVIARCFTSKGKPLRLQLVTFDLWPWPWHGPPLAEIVPDKEFRQMAFWSGNNFSHFATTISWKVLEYPVKIQWLFCCSQIWTPRLSGILLLQLTGFTHALAPRKSQPQPTGTAPFQISNLLPELLTAYSAWIGDHLGAPPSWLVWMTWQHRLSKRWELQAALTAQLGSSRSRWSR